VGLRYEAWTLPTAATFERKIADIPVIARQGGQIPSGWTRAQQLEFGVPKTHGSYVLFRRSISGEPVRTGTYSLRITPALGNGYPGAQQVVNVTPGGTYQASIWVRTASTTNKFRFVIRSIYGEYIADHTGVLGGTTVVEEGGAANTWTEYTIPNVVMQTVDGRSVDQAIFRFSMVDGDFSTTWYLDDASLTEGMAPATVGTIVTELMDDASTDHALNTRGTILDWIDYSGFTATNDSAATAWADTLSFSVYRGMTYGQVFDRLVGLGFEWDLTPKATPSGGLTHNLDWYEIGGRDSAPETAVNAGQGTVGGSVVKRIPQYTAVLVEGEGLFVEDSDAIAVTNFGRLEAYQSGFGLASTATLALAGDALLDEESANRTAVQMQVQAGDGFPRPLVDYKPGDTIWFQSPPALTRTQRRVRTVSWQNTEPPSYQVTGSRVFDTESGSLGGHSQDPAPVPAARGEGQRRGCVPRRRRRRGNGVGGCVERSCH
jgi:hypothetical protein